MMCELSLLAIYEHIRGNVLNAIAAGRPQATENRGAGRPQPEAAKE